MYIFPVPNFSNCVLVGYERSRRMLQNPFRHHQLYLPSIDDKHAYQYVNPNNHLMTRSHFLYYLRQQDENQSCLLLSYRSLIGMGSHNPQMFTFFDA